MNKKIVKKIVIAIIIILGVLLLYKIFITYFYYKNSASFEDGDFTFNKNIDTINVYNNKKANIVTLNKINIFIPKEFKLLTGKDKSSLEQDDCETFVKGLNADDSFDAMILVCDRKDYDNITNLDGYGIKNTIIPYMNVERLLDKNNIHDNIDLIKYYEKNYEFKQNIFTSNMDIKMNYIARQYVYTLIPNYDKFHYLENDIRGYSIENQRNGRYFHQVVVNHDKKNYGISFRDGNEDYFNSDNSFEIINSINIK